MSYYAKGDGFVSFIKPSEETQKEINQLSGKNGFDFDQSTKTGRFFEILFDGKYDESDTYTVLDKLNETGNILEGHIDFRGEDGNMWRFIYRDRDWVEQEGIPVYIDTQDAKGIKDIKSLQKRLKDIKAERDDLAKKVAELEAKLPKEEKVGQWILYTRFLDDAGSRWRDYSVCSSCKQKFNGHLDNKSCPYCGIQMKPATTVYREEA